METPIFKKQRSHFIFKCLLPGLTILVLAEALLAQQPASSLSALSSQVQSGDHIQVTVSDGSTLKGRYESVADSALRIRLGSRTQAISGTTITGIKKRRPDSNLNGILIGVAAGFGSALVATSIRCPNDPECANFIGSVFIPVFAAGGAGVGALLDEMTHKYDPIYTSKSTGGPRLRFSPLVSRDKKGVRLAMSF